MKLELRKKELINGGIFYEVHVDDNRVDAFYMNPDQRQEGIISDAEHDAIELFNKIKERGTHESIVTVLDSFDDNLKK